MASISQKPERCIDLQDHVLDAVLRVIHDIRVPDDDDSWMVESAKLNLALSAILTALCTTNNESATVSPMKQVRARVSLSMPAGSLVLRRDKTNKMLYKFCQRHL